MSYLLERAQHLIDESGLSRLEIAKKLKVKTQRVDELMQKTSLRGTSLIEKIFVEFEEKK